MKINQLETWPKQTQYKANTKPIKPNSRKAKMNVTSILTKDYENKPPSDPKKTNPIQTQTNPILSAIAPVLRSLPVLCSFSEGGSGEGLAKAEQTLFLKIPDNFSSKLQPRKPTILRPDVSVCHGLVCKKFML